MRHGSTWHAGTADTRGRRSHRHTRAPRAERCGKGSVRASAFARARVRRADSANRHRRCAADVTGPVAHAHGSRRRAAPELVQRRRARKRARPVDAHRSVSRAARSINVSQLPFQTAREIRDAIRARQISAVDVCESTLARIKAHNPKLNAFLAVAADLALDRARAIDRDKHAGALAGVPIALKDNIMTRGTTTTAASKMLRTFVPPYNATVVGRLEAAGAVMVGKTNCDEFAMGSSTENSAYGPSRNPWNTAHISGGSSGGSAVAVAAGFSPIALGSDTGGSIRQPAALCGIVGLKPTYGRVSRYGLIAFASSLDQIGPMTRTAYDAALSLSILAGADPR